MTAGRSVRVPAAETYRLVRSVMRKENFVASEAIALLAQRTGRKYSTIHTSYYRHLERERFRLWVQTYGYVRADQMKKERKRRGHDLTSDS